MSKKIETARKMLLDYISSKMEENGLTQEQVAAHPSVRMTQNSVSRVLSGKFSPKLDTLLGICEACNCYIFVIDKNADDDLCKMMRDRWGKVNKN